MRLNADDKRILAGIARDSLAAAVNGAAYQPPATDRQALLEKRGAFVTLKTNGALRGCIGCFVSDQPLYLTIAEYARHSALDDPRFSGRRISPAELPDVAIDISALTPLEPCQDPENIQLGTHGIYVQGRGGSGCFLPQVATETGWSVDEFWGHCCRDKAGLEWDAWKNPDTRCMIFSAEVFDA